MLLILFTLIIVYISVLIIRRVNLNILTFALVIVTGIYSFITFKLLRANERSVAIMRDQSEALSRPLILVKLLIIRKVMLCLLIQNIGKSPAKNLKITLNKNFYKYGEKKENNNLAKYPAFNNIIFSFAPGQALTFDLAQSFKIFDNNADENIMPKKFIISTSYSSESKEYNESHQIDLEAFLHMNVRATNEFDKLDEIESELNKIAENGIKVIK